MENDDNGIDGEGYKSTLVASQDSGRVLGHVNRAYINTAAGKICALSFRRKFLGKEFYLNMNEVEKIGVDIVFVRSETSPKMMSERDFPSGEDLRKFQGLWVYTKNGEALGTLADIGFNPEDWSINRLYFYDNRAIAVLAGDISIDHDRVILTSSAASPVFTSAEGEGFLSRMFGSDVVKQASIVLQRALRGMPPASQEPT